VTLRLLTLANLGWLLSDGSTKCSISAKVNSLLKNIYISCIKQEATRLSDWLIPTYFHSFTRSFIHSFFILLFISPFSSSLPNSKKARSWWDFISKCWSYLSSSKWKSAIICFKKTFEIHKDALSCFWS